MAYTVFASSFTIQVDDVLGGESARQLGEREGHAERTLHQLLGLKEALQVPHLPDASEDEDDSLSDGPPQDPLVGALTGQTKALFTILQGTRDPGLNVQGTALLVVVRPMPPSRVTTQLWDRAPPVPLIALGVPTEVRCCLSTNISAGTEIMLLPFQSTSRGKQAMARLNWPIFALSYRA